MTIPSKSVSTYVREPCAFQRAYGIPDLSKGAIAALPAKPITVGFFQSLLYQLISTQTVFAVY